MKDFNQLSLHTKIIVKEAFKRGYKIEILFPKEHFVKISHGKKFIYIRSTNLPINPSVNVLIAEKKHLTNLLFHKNNLPAPTHFVCENLKEIIKHSRKINPPYVLKPVDLTQGEGITTNIKNQLNLKKIAKKTLKKYHQVILEKYIKGKDYRLLIIDGKFVSAALRIPAKVIGNGIHTIRKLIAIENKNPLRGNKNTKPLTFIKIDQETINFLKKNNYHPESIPQKRKIVYLKETANYSKGGESKIVTSKTHKDYKILAEKAAQTIGLKFAGVDIITKDISLGLQKSLVSIIEINSSPGLRIHQFPTYGKGDDVGKVIFDMLEKYYFK